jgi:Ca2+-binding RTX toxin-like protein
LSQGSNTVFVRQTDVAGNVSGNTSFTFTYDNQVAAPTVALSTDSADNIIGTFIVGGTETGATVEYSSNSTDGTNGIWNNVPPIITETATGSTHYSFYSHQVDVAGNVSNGTKLEFTYGSTSDDILTGDGGANILIGRGGNDILEGLGGGDTLYGDTGNNTASYEHAVSTDLITGVTASLTTSFVVGPPVTPTGDAAGDIYYNIQNLTGSAYNDHLIGDSHVNILIGGFGNDILEGMGGGDRFYGGTFDGTSHSIAGNDTVSYEHASGPVTASLDSSHSNSGAAAGDIYYDIQNLTGSAYNDTLYGDANDNILMGGAGADTFWGGGGNDTVSYSNATGDINGNGVYFSLTSSFLRLGDAVGDTLHNIANLTGSDYNDYLGGDGNANILIGGLGDDYLEGFAGNDKIYANQGHDTAIGGDGNDTFYVSSHLTDVSDISKDNLPALIDGGARDASTTDGNVIVLKDLVTNGSYNIGSLANVSTNIDTLNICDGAKTTLTISSVDVQHMVNNGTGSQLYIKADGGVGGDILSISLTGTQEVVPTVDGTHTDYTIYTDSSHVQPIALIHWQNS